MSRLPFELLLALRYLRPKRTFVSFITLISVVGVTLGVAVLIIVISVMSGFDKQLRDKILGFNTHLMVMEQVLVETEPPTGQRQVGAPWLRGIEPEIETNISILPSSIVQGKFDVS